MLLPSSNDVHPYFACRSPTELFGGPQRFSPPDMLARYMADPKYTRAGIANTTVQVCVVLWLRCQ
jgi:hypothetical protein